MKKGDVRMANRFLNKRCLSAPDATSLHHCLKNKQPKLICFQWLSIQELCTVKSVANACI